VERLAGTEEGPGQKLEVGGQFDQWTGWRRPSSTLADIPCNPDPRNRDNADTSLAPAG